MDIITALGYVNIFLTTIVFIILIIAMIYAISILITVRRLAHNIKELSDAPLQLIQALFARLMK